MLLLGIAMILGGLAFKASAAPFHQWTPDVYEGAPTAVTAFMATATKVVALCVLMRVLTTAFGPVGDVWEGAVAALAIASMADRQHRRARADERQAHARLQLDRARRLPADPDRREHAARRARAPLLPDRVRGDDARPRSPCSPMRERELRATGRPLATSSGSASRRPFLGGVLAFSLLSLASFPPTGGFLAKLYLFSSAVDAGKTYLAVIGVVATVDLARLLPALHAGALHATGRRAWRSVRAAPGTAFATATAVDRRPRVVLWLGVAPGPMLDWARDAVSTLPL